MNLRRSFSLAIDNQLGGALPLHQSRVGLGRIKGILRKHIPGAAWSILKLLWAKYSFGTFCPRTVRHRFGDHELFMRLVDLDGAEWYDRDYDEFPEINLLRQHQLVAGARVFDAGANQCLQAMLMAKAVAPDGFVWAIEPNPRNAQAARQNVRINGIANCRVLEAAVSHCEGQIIMNQAMNGQVSLDGIGGRPVRAVSIDYLTAALGPPSVLYIDIEGFECAALEGAQTTLRRYVPDCVVEVHSGLGLERLGGSVEKLISFFPSVDYRLLYTTGRDNALHAVASASKLPNERFFLIALAKADRLGSRARVEALARTVIT